LVGTVSCDAVFLLKSVSLGSVFNNIMNCDNCSSPDKDGAPIYDDHVQKLIMPPRYVRDLFFKMCPYRVSPHSFTQSRDVTGGRVPTEGWTLPTNVHERINDSSLFQLFRRSQHETLS
jgi:hypothetical protein